MPETKRDYSLTGETQRAHPAAAPELPYQPRDPRHYKPGIALIGCGGISQWHLRAYRQAGYRVLALCDLVRERALARQEEFYPQAAIHTDYRKVLEHNEIQVVDVATHPAERLSIIEAALDAGKHVLSQKPFVLDLDEGSRLVEIATRRGVRLAVNQNGRWAPHFSYIREAVRAGLIGDLTSVHVGVHWDHTWTAGTPFEDIDDLVLYDFAIHWFDFAATLLEDSPMRRVMATRTRARGQKPRPPLLAQALLEFEGGQASFVFDAQVTHGPLDHTYVAGTKGSIRSTGPSLGEQTVTLTTADGATGPKLVGSWFPTGFHGTMAELLCAIEEGREPRNSAANNLRSLALCFAAIASAHDGVAKVPGEVRRLVGS